MDAFRLGPLVLSAPRLYAAVALAALVLAAEAMARGGRRHARTRAAGTPATATAAPSVTRPPAVGTPATATLDSAAWAWNTALAMLLAARIGFVLEHLDIYARAPLSALAFWQGGFSPWWGIGLGGLVVAWSFRGGWRAARGVAVPAAVALAAWLALPALSSPAATAAPALPSLVLERLGGGQLALAGLHGRPVVINLWATWCPPCRRELPLLAATAAARRDVQFVLADQREGRATVEDYLQERGEPGLGIVVLDPDGRLGSAFRSIGLPTTLFFGADGRHMATHVGELSAATLADYLAAIAP